MGKSKEIQSLKDPHTLSAICPTRAQAVGMASALTVNILSGSCPFFAIAVLLFKHSISFALNVYRVMIAGAIIMKYDFLNEISVPAHFTADIEVTANKHFPEESVKWLHKQFIKYCNI